MATRSPVNTHNYWGELSSLADLPNVAGSPTQSSTLEVGDTAFVTCALLVCTDATVGAARWQRVDPGAVGSGEVLAFEWNKTDTSQFEVAPAFASAGWTAGLTVVATPSRPEGVALQLQGLTGTGTGALVWLASAPLVFLGDNRNLIIELWIEFYTGNRYCGFSFLADDSDPLGLHCYNNLFRDAGGWHSRVDQGVLTLTAATSGNLFANEPAWNRNWIYADKVSGQVPRMAYTGIGADFGTRRTNEKDQSIFDAGGAAPATWNPLTCDRWGLCLQTAGGVANNGIHQFNHIRIWTW